MATTTRTALTKQQLYVAGDTACAPALGDNAPMSSPSAPARARTVSPYLLLTLTPFFWACNWIIGRGLSTSIPPMAMTFYRWLFAILILAPFALPHFRREWPIVWRNRRVMLLLGIVGVGSHNALAYLGLNYTTAMNGVILNSFIPVMIISLSWIFLRQRLAPCSARRRRGVARRRSRDPVAGQSGDARELPAQPRRPVRDPVDAAVVDLYDLPALEARGAAHADVPVRDRVHRRCRHSAVLPGRDGDGFDHDVHAGSTSRRLLG